MRSRVLRGVVVREIAVGQRFLCIDREGIIAYDDAHWIATVQEVVEDPRGKQPRYIKIHYRFIKSGMQGTATLDEREIICEIAQPQFESR